MARRERYLVGLDVGTSKVTAVVGEVLNGEALEIVGIALVEAIAQVGELLVGDAVEELVVHGGQYILGPCQRLKRSTCANATQLWMR